MDALRALVEHMHTFDVIPWITEGGNLYVERGMRHVITYRSEPFDIVEYERKHCDLELIEVDSLLEVCDRPQDKLLCASEPEYLQKHWRAMYVPFTAALSGMFTADFYFEFMAPGIDKGHALAGALPKLGIDASEVVAFGDGQNDISMITWAVWALPWTTPSMRPRPLRIWSPPPTMRTASRSRWRRSWVVEPAAIAAAVIRVI